MASLQLQELDTVIDPEEDIFAGISCYDFNGPEQDGLILTAKLKAQQHLAVSSDSPFNNNDQQSEHLKIYRDTVLLKQEADKILKEREKIKGRQTEIQERVVKNQKTAQEEKQPQKLTNPPRIESKQNNPTNQHRFRPLTGRVDCPNCSCDSRNSVCSLCVNFDRRASIFVGSNEVRDRFSSVANDDKKRCNLRDLRQRYGDITGEKVSSVSDRVVPGRVYTISKALDDKRVQLAQAIADLKQMKDQLRQKGNRLDEERKIVQLYRDQWRYGPSIGGPKSSSRERLGPIQQSRNYESRLDPHLARDSKAIEGFRHIEPGLKLRQYEKKIPNQPLKSLKRSKSLESVHRPKTGAVDRLNISSPKSLSPSKKSSSDANVSSPPEVAEEDISVIDTSPPVSVVEERIQKDVERVEAEVEEPDKSLNKGDTRVQKLAWIPVFGETEIKIVKRKPKVKMNVLESSRVVPTSVKTEGRSILKQPTTKSNKSKITNNRLVGEANRKLKFASDLLDQERQDSTAKNQLVIRKSTQNTSIANTPEAAPEELAEDRNMSNELKIREMLLIEEQLNEHQKQITKLVEMQHSSAPKVPKSTCCNHQAGHTSNRIPIGNKTLINNLRDRLNKTKTRLAKNLESEREKYMRLKLKVDTSLRKQSDLEKENELLKQSLSQCIDTCLKDITQTFESLSNTLADSVGGNSRQPATDDNNTDLLEIYSPDSGNLLLKNAAQVMSDNNKIKEMKSRMDAVMEQRREIFNELSKEKHKSNQLELQLKKSQNELNNLISSKQKLELKLQQEEARHSPILPSTSSTSDSISAPVEVINDTQTEPLESTTDDTFSGSIDRYRSYIKSLSPDMATLRQERKLILNEFDNIKKMLSEINTADS